MSRTLDETLRTAAKRAADKVFIRGVSEAGSVGLTFAELETRSRQIAAGLQDRGIVAGDRVAVAIPNHTEWLELFFGITRVGAIMVALNVRYREHEIEYMVNHSGARLLISSAADDGTDLEEFYAGFQDRIPGVEDVLFLGGTVPGQRYEDLLIAVSGDELPNPSSTVQSDLPAMILYTSGTTGNPKGAMLTHGSMIGAASAQVAHLGTSEEDIYLGVMPLNHVGGITCTLLSALLTTSTVVLESAFSPPSALETIAAHRVSVFAGVPTMWKLILSHETFGQLDTSSIRLAIIGGSNADPTVCQAIVHAFPDTRLCNLYGLSEVSGACVMSAADDDVGTVSRTLGVTLPGIETRIVGLDGTEVGVQSEGELQVRGPGNAAGYWRNPDDSKESFLPQGWVATGDMVSADPDGHIVLRGRRKEMFVQGGYNVYPVEVENVIASHPAIEMVAGIGVPDSLLGEVGRYYVITHADHTVTADEVTDFCAQRVAKYKIPRQIVFTAELPTTPAGKIAKATLRNQYLYANSPYPTDELPHES